MRKLMTAVLLTLSVVSAPVVASPPNECVELGTVAEYVLNLRDTDPLEFVALLEKIDLDGLKFVAFLVERFGAVPPGERARALLLDCLANDSGVQI